MERPYRSRKQKPCDKCRARKIFCARKGNLPCSLCRSRGIPCTVDGVAMTDIEDTPMDDSGPSQLAEGANQRRQNDAAYAGGSQYAAHISRLNGTPTLVERFVGLSSDLDPYILRHHNWLNLSQHDDKTQWRCDRRGRDPYNPIHFEVSIQDRLEISLSQAYATSILEKISPYQQDLLHAFDRYAHSSYPLLGPGQPSKMTVSSTLTIAICSLAHNFCLRAQRLSEDVYKGFDFQGLAAEIRLASLETIEAALLFQQRNAYANCLSDMRGNYVDTCNIIAATQDLGLQIDCKDWNIPLREKRRRRRIWWAVFIQDKWSALALGRPPLLKDTEANVTMPERSDFAADGEEEPPTEISQGVDVFIAMVGLTHIMSDVLTTCYSLHGLNHCLSLPEEEIISLYERYSQELEKWTTEQLEPLRHSGGSLDVTGALELAAYTVHIIVFRAVLPKLDLLHAPTYALRNKALLTVSSVMTALKNLTVSRTSVLWWPVPHVNLSTINRFTVGMILSSVDSTDAKTWTATLATFQELLSIHSAGFPVARYANAQAEIIPTSAGLVN